MRRSSLKYAGLAVIALMTIDAMPASAALTELVVTARKRAEGIQEVPIAITAFTGDQLKLQSVQDFRDIQYQVPGFRVGNGFSDANSVTLRLRGQGQADLNLTTDPSVGVYIDGALLPRTLGLRANMFDLERVEVLKGPQGTLYGKNTTGGAVNIITKKPDHDEFGGFVDVIAGDYDRIDVGAGVNIPLSPGKSALRVSAQSTNRDGFGDQAGTGRELRDDSANLVRAQLSFDANDKVSVLLSADYQDIDEEGAILKMSGLLDPTFVPGEVDVVSIFPPIINVTDPLFGPAATAEAMLELQASGALPGQDTLADPLGDDSLLLAADAALRDFIGGDPYVSNGTGPQFSKFETHGFAGTIEAEMDGFNIKSITSYREFERSNRLDLDGTPFDILDVQFDTDDEIITQELQFTGTAMDDKLDWLLGVFYSKEEGTDSSINTATPAAEAALLLSDPMAVPFNPQIISGEIENKSWAVFGQGTFQITDLWSITAGVRYTDEEKSMITSNSIGGFCVVPGASPLAGLVPGFGECSANIEAEFDDYSYLLSSEFQVNDDLLVYAKTSRGFRAGGHNLRGNGLAAESFSPFDPEIATDYEIGVKSDPANQKLRINAAVYFTDYEDVQRTAVTALPAGGVTTFTDNLGDGEIWGAELELYSQPIENLFLSGTFDWVDAEYDDGVRFGTPEYTYSVSGRYVVPTGAGDLGFQADWYWQSEDNFFETTVLQDSVSQDDYGLLNARIDYDMPEKGMNFAVFAKNLTDEEYRVAAIEFAGAFGYNVAMTGDPLTWGVQFTKRFGGG